MGVGPHAIERCRREHRRGLGVAVGLNDVLAKASELFNRKLYFECHDILEDAWAGAGAVSRRAGAPSPERQAWGWGPMPLRDAAASTGEA